MPRTKSEEPSTREKKKDGSLSFRVPKQLRKAIQWGAKKEGESQSDFIIQAALDFAAKFDELPEDVKLPEDFEIPTAGSKMVTIRVTKEAVKEVSARAPRLYHSTTRWLLIAAALRAYKCAEEAAATKTSK
jgi:hypothetical protein